MDDLTHLYSLSVVNFHHIETEAVHSFSRSHENTPCRIEMTPNVHQNLMEYRKTHGYRERPDWLPHALLIKQLKEGTIIYSMHCYLVEVYVHGAVAHLRRFVVVVPHSREGDAAASGAHRHSQSAPGGFCGRSGVANH